MAPAPTTQTFNTQARGAGNCGPGPSAHVQTAVQREVGAGGERGLLAHQPGDDRGDLFRFPQPLDRDAADDSLEPVGFDGPYHVGADIPGRHGVDGDATRCDLLRQRHGETMDARLGGRVIGLTELAALAVHRGDVDDAAPAAPLQAGGWHAARARTAGGARWTASPRPGGGAGAAVRGAAPAARRWSARKRVGWRDERDGWKERPDSPRGGQRC